MTCGVGRSQRVADLPREQTRGRVGEGLRVKGHDDLGRRGWVRSRGSRRRHGEDQHHRDQETPFQDGNRTHSLCGTIVLPRLHCRSARMWRNW